MKYWVNFAGVVLVEADTPEKAEQNFWQEVTSFDIDDILSVEEAEDY